MINPQKNNGSTPLAPAWKDAIGSRSRDACNFAFRLVNHGPFRILRRRWEDNIRMDLREIVWEGVDWMHVAYGRDQWRALVNAVMNLPVP